MTSRIFRDNLQAYVDGVIERHGIPALSVAVWNDNALQAAAGGTLNLDSGLEAGINSVFQIGSISKAFTASLIMLLVDEGKVDLDKPLRCYLPSFHVADRIATGALTVRHLLSHTSGLVSDCSLAEYDVCEGGNDIARYVDRCFLLPQAHKEFGERFSYSNAAYVIVGRLVEVLSGVSWRKAVENFIFKPLGMTESLASPMDVLRFSAAMGHFLSGGATDRRAVVASGCYMPMGMAPTGSVLTMSASDLVRFGKAHLDGGKTESGKQWMSQQSIRMMREKQVSLPAPPLTWETGWGLGWSLTEGHGIKMFGHRGGTIGQEAVLGIIPERNVVFSAQLNASKWGGAPVLQEVIADIIDGIGGIRPKRTMLSGESVDPERFVGEFGETGFRITIKHSDGNLVGRVEPDSSDFPSPTLRLLPAGRDRFAAYALDGEQMDDFNFLECDSRGVPRYLFWHYRLHGRVRA